jgi:hypothetical protein
MRANAVKPVKDMPSFVNSHSENRQRGAGIVNWLFGPGNAPQPLVHTEPLPGPDIRITPPVEGNFWVESFFNALTEATTLFAKRHVELVHQEDPSTLYRVREVKIECKDAPAQFHRDVLSLPALVRNRVVKSRMQKAPGGEYLMLNDFFGSTIAGDITLVEGQIVQTMVSYSGSRFMLKFAFEGDYVTRSAPPEPATLAAAGAASAERGNPTPTQAQAGIEPDRPLPLRQTLLRAREEDLPLSASRATPLQTMATPAIRPVANVRLRSLGIDLVVPLLEDNFPYTIGRHPSFQGYCVRGERDTQAVQLLHEVEQAGFCSFVSREHIVLDSYDATTQQFRVAAARGKNGTYFKANAMPSHFLLSLAVMAKGEWLKLGGTGGDGILEVRFEAA